MRSSIGLIMLLSCLVVGLTISPAVQLQAKAPTPSLVQGQPQAGAPPQGQQPPAGPPGAPGAQGPGRAAPPPPKNLKVLPKDWTRQQVQAVMATFMESLGLANGGAPGTGCDHCHVADPAAPAVAGRGPTLAFDLDTNPKKDIARKMIQMVAAANAEYLKGVTDPPVAEPVSCFTCHRGDANAKPPSAPPNGWTRGGFSLLPAGPVVAGRGRGGLN
jgi:hypothetical protein